MGALAERASLPDRMVRAAKLDSQLYEEVEADTTATSQALTVVVLSAVAAGLGATIAAAIGGEAANPIAALIGGILAELLGWAVWSFVMFFVGTRFFGGIATYGELLRTLGFAYAPGVLLILTFIPLVGGLLGIAVAIWRLVTGFVAVRQALDLDNGKTVATILIGFLAYLIVFVIVATILGVMGVGLGLMGV